jgi:hypothetical protein
MTQPGLGLALGAEPFDVVLETALARMIGCKCGEEAS